MKRKLGFTLILTLVVIALISVLVVGMVTGIRIERVAANSDLERARAEMLAQEGVETVVAKLAAATASNQINWISQPGKIFFSDPAAANFVITKEKDLSAGVGQGVALNSPSLLTTDHLLNNSPGPNGVPPQMELPWIYLRQDGQIDLDQNPAYSKSNPIVGRYSYWADDESSKINYNIAWGRKPDNDKSESHPSRIDLTALPSLDSTMADELQETAAIQPFNSPEDARRTSASLAEVLRMNKFDVTHYNHDPDTTFFNEPRIVLTTQKKHAQGRPFLDVLTDPGTESALSVADPGRVSSVSETKLRTVLYGPGGTVTNPIKPGLVYYLSRQDWPMVAGSASLQDKFYSSYATTEQKSRLTQIALNIIDYVRSKESNEAIVQPIRAYIENGTGNFLLTPTSPPSGQTLFGFCGVARGVSITEMGVYWSAPVAGTCTVQFLIELYLPYNYGLSSIDLGSYYLWEGMTSSGGAKIISGGNIFPLGGTGTTPEPLLERGKYLTLVKQFTTTTARPATVALRMALGLQPASDRLEMAPLAHSLTYTLDAPTIQPANITSFSVDDPRINKHPDNWGVPPGGVPPGAQGPNTFNSANSNSLLKTSRGPDPGVAPQQDMGADGNLSTASLYMPPPRGKSLGSDNNVAGIVTSVGELGYVTTGVEATVKRGTPWRSLRLQPNQDNHQVPDWALLDIFTVPADAPNAKLAAFYSPHGNATGGRINLNAFANPFDTDDGDDTNDLRRLTPLMAVLTGASYDSQNPSLKLTNDEARTIAGHIYDKDLAVTGPQEGKAYPVGGIPLYDSPGEVCEIEGVANKGEESEELVRQIANLITTRGNVFSVYSIGQALKQPSPNLPPVVTAEHRDHAMVERYLYTNPATGTPEVGFRTLYYRNLAQ